MRNLLRPIEKPIVLARDCTPFIEGAPIRKWKDGRESCMVVSPIKQKQLSNQFSNPDPFL